jgi:hypothetical protein
MVRVPVKSVVVLPTFAAQDAQAILAEASALYRAKVYELAKEAIEGSDDLFPARSPIPDGDLASFQGKRPDWLARFDVSLKGLLERRLYGERRRGRRPDADVSLATLRVLTAFDHEKQAALSKLARTLRHFTRRETMALDLRIEALLGYETGRDLDNPFGVDYVLDALGSTSRAVYPSPQVWRPLMERIVADITPSYNNVYIAVNRVLADRGVLPEIKALLRVRSEHRPSNDGELFNTFTQLLHDAAGTLAADVIVPDLGPDAGAPPPLVFSNPAASAPLPSAPLPSAPAVDGSPHAGAVTARRVAAVSVPQAVIAAGLASLAARRGGEAGPDAAIRGAEGEGELLPSVDPLMALGTSSPLFATLGQWQREDLAAAILNAVPPAVAEQAMVVPLNLIPYIRSAIADEIANPADRVTIDVIALLFDYIFRDRSIPESLRQLFSRLQVPILKAALLDRSFFSDKKHPARMLLDHLAEASIGADANHRYGIAIRELASHVVDELCRDFEIDVAAFGRADQRIVDFIDGERERLRAATSGEIEVARSTEAGDLGRAEVRNLIRERLAGLAVPFDVHSFIETSWADYLALLRARDGNDSPSYVAAVETIDDLLWSITAKERSAQKTRLAKMIPRLIGALRKGVAAMRVEPARANPFFETIYALHVAAISPRARSFGEPATSSTDTASARVVNVHDYVGDMVVGTWVSFTVEAEPLAARLIWVSPMRGKYIFANHTPARILKFTAEELAYELGTGKARIIVEPVPLFDRAVSTALDQLAAHATPPSAQAAPA